MRCCICGKETDRVKEGMCESCFSKEKSPFSIKRRIDIQVCKHCGRFYLGGWEHGTVHDIIQKAVFYYLEPKKMFEIVKKIKDEKNEDQIRIEFFRTEEKIDLDIELLTVHEFKIREELTSEIHLNYTTCPRCAKIRGGYYEAVLQIRRENTELTKEEREDMVRIIEGTHESEEVSKLTNRKEGIDIYFITKKAAKISLKRLKSRYGGSIKRSFERIGEEKYRTISVLRLPQYKEGMIVERQGELFVVEDAKDSLHLRTLSGEKKHFQWRDIEEDEFTILEKPKVVDVMVTEITPEKIQIMSLERYETQYIPQNELPEDINITVKKEYKAIRKGNRLNIWWDYGHREEDRTGNTVTYRRSSDR